MKNNKVRIGIVGVVGRGQIFVDPILMTDYADITAICDINVEGMKKYEEKIGKGVKVFTNYEEMIDSGLIDAVFVATPMPLHVPMSIYALDRNIHVISEVTAAVTVEECRELYKAVKRSKAQYMMAENVNFFKDVMIIDGLVKAGYLGKIHYAEGHYIHYTGDVIDPNSWRFKTIAGCNYCTHNLGPMLQWFGNERIAKICCIGSGMRRQAPTGEFARSEMANVLMCKTESGRLMQVRKDGGTPTPYMIPFEICGTIGKVMVRKSSPVEENYVYLNTEEYDHTPYAEEWKSLQYYEREFLPKSWVEATRTVPNMGHLRADYVMTIEIVKALYEGRKLPIDIDMALNMTVPGILSIESIENGCKWIDVPKFDVD